jgi:peptidoglycan-associated lipoprotein
MRKKVWIGLVMVMVIPVLVLTVSCAKKSVRTETATTTQPTDDEALMQAKQAAEQEEAARSLEEKERMADEAAQREMMAARNLFLNEDIYFEFDSSALLFMAQEVLKQKAQWMRDNPNVSVVIEGHCDERGTNEYNLALGDRRANSAKAFLVDLGIREYRLTTISYGEERPVDTGHNEEAWAKNRRAHFVIE